MAPTEVDRPRPLNAGRPQTAPQPFARWDAAAGELLYEITTAAERIVAARTSSGERVQRTDALWRLLETVERSRYCLAIADVARALGVTRQTAHPLCRAAAGAGYVELLPNPDDRRILQVLLTPHARAELKRVRSAEGIRLHVLLSGLGDHDLAQVTRVLRVIRQRLERDDRERRRLSQPGFFR
jgi:DNA-binding MarR family transcriptional regulator